MKNAFSRVFLNAKTELVIGLFHKRNIKHQIHTIKFNYFITKEMGYLKYVICNQ